MQRGHEVAEDAARLLSEAEPIAGFGCFAWDIRSGRTRWTEQLHRIGGLDPATTVASFEHFLERVVEEDRARVRDVVAAALRSPGAYRLSYRLARPDGTIREIESYNHIFADDEGPTRMVGVVHDVTDLRRVERDLRVREARYRSLVEALAHIIWIATPDGDIVEDSPSFRAYSGVSLEQMLDRGWEAAVHPEDQGRGRAAWQRAVDTGSYYECELRVRSASGDYRWFVLRGAPIRDEGGAIVEWIGTCTDIHDQRLAAETAARAQRDLSRLIDELPDAVGVVRDGRFVYVNAGYARLLGYASPAELAAKRPIEILHPDEVERARALAKSGYRDGPDLSEWKLLARSGEVVVVECVRPVMIEIEGAPAEMTIARDIRLRKSLESRLRVTDRMASVGTLAAGVAHEINNPLTFVSTNVELAAAEIPALAARLRASPDPDALRAIADRLDSLGAALCDARSGSHRVRAIVRDLMTFSRDAEDRRERVDLARVIDGTIGLAWNEIRHRARLVKTYRATQAVEASEGRLGQVVLNLLVNAAQALPEGHVDEHEIRVTTRDRGPGVELSIRDTGAGIDPRDLPRVFEPFFTSKVRGTGTGLGLAICQGIVSSLGGEITIESELGRGTTVRVLLPAAPALPASAAEPREPAHEAPERRAGCARGRVLVIDDEPQLVSTLVRLLSEEHDVVGETDARTALRRLSQDRFDVVLCDLMMPDVTGMELHAELSRRDPVLADRIVFLTGGAFTASARAFLDRVRNARLEKPFDGESLFRLVRAQVESRPRS